MRKWLLVFVLLLTFSTISFAEPLDDEYIDLIFDKFASYNEETKKEKSEELMLFMEDDARLNLLYTIIVTTKSDAMATYNISESDVRKNIDALKTWSKLDRYKLIEAGAEGDRSTVDALNEKYTPAPDSTPIPNPNPTPSPLPIIPVEDVILEDEETPLAGFDFTQILKASGFLNQPVQVKYEGKTFTDIKNHWSKQYVEYLAEREIISGYNADTFGPNDPIKKSEIVTLLMRLVVVDSSKITSYKGSIPDLEYGNWYDGFMKNAYTLGIIEPNYLGYMEPNHHSTREEVVDMLIKSIEALGIEIDESLKEYSGSFTDFNEVKPELKDSMAIAINLNFISGLGNNTIAPGSDITRGQIAVVINKLYLYILEEIDKEVTSEN